MNKKNRNVIVLTGGGTAGHCIPCLALLPILKKHFDDIVYIGSENGIEKKLANEKGLDYHSVACIKLERRLTIKNLAIPFTLLKGIKEAKKILTELSPSVVFSKGGYVSLPVAIAAANLNIPVSLHESDLSLGLANRIASKYADVVCTGFQSTAEDIKNGVFTGNPLREELLNKRADRAIYDKLNLDKTKRTLLVFGGSQGAEKINETLYSALDELLKSYNIIHAAGKGKLRDIKKKGYYGVEYLTDIGTAFSIADVCVSRAGANALAETVALKIPTVAIPLPKGNSRGDQEENAAYYENRGAIRVIKESELTAKKMIREIETAYKTRDGLKKHCEKCIPLSPNLKIVDEIIKITR